MLHENTLDARRAALAVIDVQEAFRQHMPDFAEVAARCALVAHAARLLGLPVVVTEQYPKGLGTTVSEVAEHLPGGVEPLEKVRFSAAEADGFGLGERNQVLICGIETHVCVAQTTLDLLDDDVEVHVAADAVGSRFERNRELGLTRMERSGALLTSVEMALFELLGGSDAPAFKEVQALVK